MYVRVALCMIVFVCGGFCVCEFASEHLEVFVSVCACVCVGVCVCRWGNEWGILLGDYQCCQRQMRKGTREAQQSATSLLCGWQAHCKHTERQGMSVCVCVCVCVSDTETDREGEALIF